MDFSAREYTTFQESVSRVLDDLDFPTVVGANAKILIKPNCINSSPPPVTTPVECCEAIIRSIREAALDAEVVVGEGCGDSGRETFEVFCDLGYDRLAREYGIELVDLNTEPLVRLSQSDSRIFPEIYLPEILFDHYVISVPVLKAHTLARITGTLKNMMGAAPPKYYGGNGGSWKKAFFHNHMQESIVELNRYRMADLSIVDGSVGLAQSHLGGATCDPPVNKIVGGYDAVRVDRACAELLGLRVENIAHIQEDECGAPEKFNGIKLLPVQSGDGKITVEGIKPHVKGIGFEHHSQPRVVSITQATEMGTVYKPEEIMEITDYAHQHGMYVHMDGARIANAATSLNMNLREITTDVGVDVLSFGGTKNGLMYGEAVVFLNARAPEEFKFIRKQGMQLASKMRFVSAQFLRYLSGDLWYQTAQHANQMARLLAEEAQKIPGIEITQKVEANGVFARVPRNIIPTLQEEVFFYIWDEPQSVVRWMTSFDTTEQEIYDFVDLIRKLVDKG